MTTLLKVKSFHDDEATVVAHIAGKGKHKGRLGALLVQKVRHPLVELTQADARAHLAAQHGKGTGDDAPRLTQTFYLGRPLKLNCHEPSSSIMTLKPQGAFQMRFACDTH